MTVRVEFDNDESYQTGPGPAVFLGNGFGYANLEGVRVDREEDFVILDFGNGRFMKIPRRRLLRITEG